MRPPPWKVGELARRTGVSAADAPSLRRDRGCSRRRTARKAGYRLYTEADVVRLQQIRSLRTLGFSLEEIGTFLKRPDVTPDRILQATHRTFEGADRNAATPVRPHGSDREALAVGRDGPHGGILKIIEVTTMLDKYYTPEQMESLRQRREALGEDRMRQAEADWEELTNRSRRRWTGARTRRTSGYSSSPGVGWASSRSSPAATPASPSPSARCTKRRRPWPAWTPPTCAR